MARSGEQYKLFETEARFENGFLYKPDFISEDEEELLIAFIEAQPMKHATDGTGKYASKRRYANFGWQYDFKHERLIPGPELPKFLGRFARRIEKMLDLPRGRVVEALINEYPKGAAIGWHKDNEPFEHVIGLSLSGWARMRLRPAGSGGTKRIQALEVEPRSVYVLQGASRENWQHSIANTKTLRYSITFRTLPKGTRTPRRTYGSARRS